MRGQWRYKQADFQWMRNSGECPMDMRWDVITTLLHLYSGPLYAYWIDS